MYCSNNDPVCRRAGDCSCSDSEFHQASGNLMGYAFIVAVCCIFIVFAAFGVSAWNIANASKTFNARTGKPEFAGLAWLYLSPFTVGASAAMIAIGLVALVHFSPLGIRDDHAILLYYQAMLPLMAFAAGMVLTLGIFTIKNFSVIRTRLKNNEFFAAENRLAATLILSIATLTLLSIPGTILTGSLLKIYGGVKYKRRLEYLAGDYFYAFAKKPGGLTMTVKIIDGDRIKLLQSGAEAAQRAAGCEAVVSTSALANGTNDFVIGTCTIGPHGEAIRRISFRGTDSLGTGKKELILFSPDTAYTFSKRQ